MNNAQQIEWNKKEVEFAKQTLQEMRAMVKANGLTQSKHWKGEIAWLENQIKFLNNSIARLTNS